MTKTVSIDDLGLNAVADSDTPQPMTVFRADGQSTVLKLHVLGKFATAVEKSNAKFYQKFQKQAEMEKRKGSKVSSLTYEDAKREDLEATMARVVGWEGVSQEYTEDGLRKLLTDNPHIKTDVVDFSDELTNFTKTA